jgi:hypothetical protein
VKKFFKFFVVVCVFQASCAAMQIDLVIVGHDALPFYEKQLDEARVFCRDVHDTFSNDDFNNLFSSIVSDVKDGTNYLAIVFSAGKLIGNIFYEYERLNGNDFGSVRMRLMGYDQTIDHSYIIKSMQLLMTYLYCCKGSTAVYCCRTKMAHNYAWLINNLNLTYDEARTKTFSEALQELYEWYSLEIQEPVGGICMSCDSDPDGSGIFGWTAE